MSLEKNLLKHVLIYVKTAKETVRLLEEILVTFILVIISSLVKPLL